MADQPVHRDCLRNRIERFFNKLQQFRRIATRYDKFAANCLPMIEIATIRISSHADESTTQIAALEGEGLRMTEDPGPCLIR